MVFNPSINSQDGELATLKKLVMQDQPPKIANYSVKVQRLCLVSYLTFLGNVPEDPAARNPAKKKRIPRAL